MNKREEIVKQFYELHADGCLMSLGIFQKRRGIKSSVMDSGEPL
jgi:hypothetical protein